MGYKIQEEQKSIDLYGTKDLGCMDKEEKLTFTSTLHEMNPDVAKSVSEHFSEYFDACDKLADKARSTFDKTLENMDQKFQTKIDALKASKVYLSQCLDKAETDEARMAIIEKIEKVDEKIFEEADQATEEVAKQSHEAYLVFIAIAAISVTVLGVSLKAGNVKTPNFLHLKRKT